MGSHPLCWFYEGLRFQFVQAQSGKAAAQLFTSHWIIRLPMFHCFESVCPIVAALDHCLGNVEHLSKSLREYELCYSICKTYSIIAEASGLKWDSQVSCQGLRGQGMKKSPQSSARCQALCMYVIESSLGAPLSGNCS